MLLQWDWTHAWVSLWQAQWKDNQSQSTGGGYSGLVTWDTEEIQRNNLSIPNTHSQCTQVHAKYIKHLQCRRKHNKLIYSSRADKQSSLTLFHNLQIQSDALIYNFIWISDKRTAGVNMFVRRGNQAAMIPNFWKAELHHKPAGHHLSLFMSYHIRWPL